MQAPRLIGENEPCPASLRSVQIGPERVFTLDRNERSDWPEYAVNINTFAADAIASGEPGESKETESVTETGTRIAGSRGNTRSTTVRRVMTPTL